MNIDTFLNFFIGQGLIFFFFRAFAVMFTFIYLLYAIVFVRQITVLNKTLMSKGGGLIAFISFLHLLFAFLLVGLLFLI